MYNSSLLTIITKLHNSRNHSSYKWKFVTLDYHLLISWTTAPGNYHSSLCFSLAVLKIDSTCNWDHAVFRVPPLTELYSRKLIIARNPLLRFTLHPIICFHQETHSWLRKNVCLYSEPLSRFHITLQSADDSSPCPSEQVWSPLVLNSSVARFIITLLLLRSFPSFPLLSVSSAKGRRCVLSLSDEGQRPVLPHYHFLR